MEKSLEIEREKPGAFVGGLRTELGESRVTTPTFLGEAQTATVCYDFR